MASTIGQFGSGANAIDTLLCAGLKLLIYCGKPAGVHHREETIRDGLVTKNIKRWSASWGNEQQDAGHGLVWTSALSTGLICQWPCGSLSPMPSTAPCGKGGFPAGVLNEDLRVAIVEDSAVGREDGCTRVFVEVNPDVQRFYGELPRRFLHFSGNPSLARSRSCRRPTGT